MTYDKKAFKQGYSISPDDEKFLEANTDPRKAKASGHGYNSKFDDDTGFERGAQSQGSDDQEFLRASTAETGAGTGKDVHSIYSDAMADQGPGPYGEGGSSVRQVGGGGGPPRYPAKSSKQARDDQNNNGI